MKALQDAYIVAATRAPVGKSGRGALRTTRTTCLPKHLNICCHRCQA